MSNKSIVIQNLSKSYLIGKEKDGSLRSTLSTILSKTNNVEEFWALKDFNLEIEQGEVVGIIGKNGAGKSTLLKLLSQITAPTSGRIELTGRVASLLEVGTGFHPELTGLENIYLNGTILGMSRKEVKVKLDEIIEFSGVEKFINTPLKHYSSGMKVRLAFAVAAHLEPEILIIDEVLAVGDAEFQKKCLGKMRDVSQQGRTVLFVSHDMGAIQNLCTRGVWLSGGEVQYVGSIHETIDRYLSSSISAGGLDLRELNRQGDGRVKFTEWYLNDDSGAKKSIAISGSPVRVVLEYEKTEEELNDVLFWMSVRKNGEIVFVCTNYIQSGPTMTLAAGTKGKVECIIEKNPLFSGSYEIALLCVVKDVFADYIDPAGELNVENGDFFGSGKLPKERQGMLVSHHWTQG